MEVNGQVEGMDSIAKGSETGMPSITATICPRSGSANDVYNSSMLARHSERLPNI